MKRSKAGVVVIPFLMFYLQAGCATVQPGQGVDKGNIAVRDLAKDTRSWDGSLLPPYPQGQPEVTIRRITIQPGSRLEWHTHPVINAGVLLSGELTVVTKDGKTLQLKAGDPNIEVVNTLHYGINQGTAPAEIIVFYAGAAGVPINAAGPR